MKFINLKIFKLTFLFLIAFCTYDASSQTHRNRNDEIQKQIEELLKQRDEMFKSLLDDSYMNHFDDRMQDLIKKFEKEGFGDFGLFGEENIFGEFDWIENQNEKIFSLKVKQIKDKPLDIKIEKGFIAIKGEVESISSNRPGNKGFKKIRFERSFSIPLDVDQTNPSFENKSGELLIKFKKLASSIDHKKSDRPIQKNKALPSREGDRVPVERSDTDLTI